MKSSYHLDHSEVHHSKIIKILNNFLSNEFEKYQNKYNELIKLFKRIQSESQVNADIRTLPQHTSIDSDNATKIIEDINFSSSAITLFKPTSMMDMIINRLTIESKNLPEKHTFNIERAEVMLTC